MPTASSPPKSVAVAAAPLAATPPARAHAHSGGGDGAESTPEISPKMSRREEVALKAAAKKREDEDNFSFKPHLAHRKKKNGDPESPAGGAGAGAGEEAYSRLYTDARRKQEEAKIQSSLPPPDTFRPTLAHRSTSVVKDKARAQSPIESSNRLFRTSHRQSRPEAPQASFKPTISKRAKSLERNPGVSTSDRLYAQAVITKEKQEKMRETLRKQEESSLTFAPSTNESSKPKGAGDRGAARAPPVSDRMQSYIEARSRKLEEAKKEKEAREAAEFTGRPSIGTRRKDSKAVPLAGANVFDRLTKVEAAHIPEKDAEETFKPTIFTSKRAQSAGRAGLVARDSLDSLGSEKLHDRLYKEAEQRRRELAAERDLARQEEEKQLTFTPQISTRATDGQHEVSQRGADGAPLSVFRRLNSVSKDEAIRKNMRTKAQQELEECTFHPTINQKSAGLFQ
jgi:hypothetical protein